jgi:hypothetical protein
VLGLEYHEIARRSDSIIGLSMLTLVYRSIPPEKPSTSVFCQDCIDAARDALQEHGQCVTVIEQTQGKTVYLEAYVNWWGSSLVSHPLNYSWKYLTHEMAGPLPILPSSPLSSCSATSSRRLPPQTWST